MGLYVHRNHSGLLGMGKVVLGLFVFLVTIIIFFFFSFFFFTTVLSQWYFPWEIRIAFPGESKLRQSRAAQPTLPAGCFSVSIIHRTLTWTTGSLTCAQMLMRAIAHRDIRTHVRESALKVDSGRKFLAAPGNQTCVSSVPFRCSTNELNTTTPELCSQ